MRERICQLHDRFLSMYVKGFGRQRHFNFSRLFESQFLKKQISPDLQESERQNSCHFEGRHMSTSCQSHVNVCPRVWRIETFKFLEIIRKSIIKRQISTDLQASERQNLCYFEGSYMSTSYQSHVNVCPRVWRIETF